MNATATRPLAVVTGASSGTGRELAAQVGFEALRADQDHVVAGPAKNKVQAAQAANVIGADTVNYESDSVAAELRERTRGRGPDVCTEAVGTEAGYRRAPCAAALRPGRPAVSSRRPRSIRTVAVTTPRPGGSVGGSLGTVQPRVSRPRPRA